MTKQESREFMRAARLWAAVLVQAVRDYNAGDLDRSWFTGETATLITAVVIIAGLAGDVIADVEAIRAAA
jgi:hypothetical protein